MSPPPLLSLRRSVMPPPTAVARQRADLVAPPSVCRP
jgi:hypothetical protein